MNRAYTAVIANARTRGFRHTIAPCLTECSPLSVLCDWLQTVDPNGCHLPHLAEAEGFDPYTEGEAWEQIAEMLEAT